MQANNLERARKSLLIQEIRQNFDMRIRTLVDLLNFTISTATDESVQNQLQHYAKYYSYTVVD